MGNLNIKFIFLSVFFLAACGRSIKPASNSTDTVNPTSSTIVGKVMGTNNSVIDLTSDYSGPQIVMFVSDSCSICRHETMSLVAHFKQNGLVKNVKLYSILIGAIAEDASDWSQSLGVTWDVGIDPGDQIYRTYCPEHKTPCLLIKQPNNQITKLIGAHDISELQTYTGPWSY